MPLFMRFIFAALGVGIIAWSFRLRRQSQVAAGWPEVEGEITRARVVNDPHLEDPQFELEYRYAVEGRAFTADRIGYSLRIPSRRANRKLLARYREGQRVRVYYDPSQPQNSVLESRASSSWLIGTGLGFAFIAFSIWGPYAPGKG